MTATFIYALVLLDLQKNVGSIDYSTEDFNQPVERSHTPPSLSTNDGKEAAHFTTITIEKPVEHQFVATC